MKFPVLKKLFYFTKTVSIKRNMDVLYKNKALFSDVEIETINRCNGSCSFCPVNKYQKQRPFAKMTSELFYKIIKELSIMQYEGRVCLHCNNEPFLDERIVDFAKHAREMLPSVYLNIFTNGTLLDRENVLNIMKYLDSMYIDNYNDNLELNEKTKMVHEICKENNELNKKITIGIRKENEILYSRGGKHQTKKMQGVFPYHVYTRLDN